MGTRAHPSLFAGLVDDAAVFPPGLAPLPRAVEEHIAREAYRRYVGPLLVPAAAAAEVVSLADGRALRLGLIARPGMPLEPVVEGARLLQEGVASGAHQVSLAGVEVGAASDWKPLVELGVPVTVEIPREGRDDALEAVHQAAVGRMGRPPIQAKLRTGATETWAWPDEHEVARFIEDCAVRSLPFKLTGGLHHILRADRADGPQHGLLNILAAVTVALDGGELDQLVEILQEPSIEPVGSVVVPLLPDEAERVRRAFTAYGCCDVLDPLRELAEVGIIDPEPAPA